ncbi:MAG: preprotein translocase subunit SecG [Thermoleophilia bacterium]|nr:preprotein translocase subunit SecG [Thermoleophilia bacterium]
MTVGIVIFFHVIFSILLVTLVLMHSGRDSGLGSIGGGVGQSGGQHVMERNLDRVTVIVAVLYLVSTLTLAKIFT